MESDKGSRLETFVAILIAITAVLGAVIAWRASVVADASGDADYDGLRSAVFAEETHALNAVNAYEHYGSFTAYTRYSQLGNSLAAELEQTEALNEEQAAELDRQRAEAYDLARANQFLFDSRFVQRDGSYALQRELGEMWADATREKDLNPEPKFAEADTLRVKSNNMLVTIAVLGVALVFYSLVETVGDRWKILFLALGTVCLIGGVIAAVLLELAK